MGKPPLPGLGGQMPPKRPVYEFHPDMPGEAGEAARFLKETIADSLMEHTLRVAKKLKATGVSVVFMSVQHMWGELIELNREAAADYFRALADLAEAPDHETKKNAEQRRRDARTSLLASLEAEMVREAKNG